MRDKRQRKTTRLFLAILAFCGGITYLGYVPWPFLNTFSFCLQIMLYAGLVLFWLQSVRTRLLPSRARRYIEIAAVFMILMLVLRALRYRITTSPVFELYCWYAYYVPLLMIAALFLSSCLRLGRSEADIGLRVYWPLPVTLALIAGMLTNELHHLAFAPLPPETSLSPEGSAFTHGPLFFITFGWIVLTLLLGIVVLARANARFGLSKKTALPLAMAAAMPLLLGMPAFFESLGGECPWQFPEISVFAMLGMFEICIRCHLIPYNDDYPGFFASLHVPAMITDTSLRPVYQTAQPMNLPAGTLRSSLSGPVHLDEDTRLMGMPVQAGLAFWVEDERELHRLNERLRDMGETLAHENELIEAENELREQQAHVDLRNRVYAQVAAEMYPAQKRLAALLEAARPHTPGFRETIARALVLDAFIKRGSNLLLADAEQDEIRSRELYLALQESARYLVYCGVTMQMASFQDGVIARRDAVALYTAFEEFLEAALPQPKKLSVAYSDAELRLTMGDFPLPALPDSRLPVRAERSDGLLYLTIRAKGGAA